MRCGQASFVAPEVVRVFLSPWPSLSATLSPTLSNFLRIQSPSQTALLVAAKWNLSETLSNELVAFAGFDKVSDEVSDKVLKIRVIWDKL